jgi:hypothetical protein
MRREAGSAIGIGAARRYPDSADRAAGDQQNYLQRYGIEPLDQQVCASCIHKASIAVQHNSNGKNNMPEYEAASSNLSHRRV